MKSLLKLFGAAALAVGLASNVMAGLITGAISMGGSANLDTQTLSTATKVTSFNSPVLVTAVGGALGSFVSVGNTVTMAPSWTFTSGQSAMWKVGGFTFDLTSSNILDNPRTDTVLNVAGIGTLSGNGYDPTPGSWTFQANTHTGNATFGFTAGTTALPDGGTTAMLLGLGLTGLAMLARWRKIA